MSNLKGYKASPAKSTRKQLAKEAAKSLDQRSAGRRSSVGQVDVCPKLKDKLEEEVEVSEESTRMFAKQPSGPPDVYQDDCDTVANPLRLKQTTMNKVPPANGEVVQRAKPDPNKIAQILNSPPLRDRYSHLLPSHMILPIGFLQVKLLEKVGCLERTISFLQTNRGRKANFFADLKKHIYECLKVTITEEDLQRIIYLAPSFYDLIWEKNQRIKRYDIVIKMPPGCVETEDVRKTNFRRAIVDYLSRLHEDFLSKQKSVGPIPAHKWHPNFNVEEIEIPLGRLPDHPLEKNLSVNTMTENQVHAIENKKVREVVQSERDLSTKSETKSAAASFLEQKKEYGSLTNRLFQIVRQKERKLKEAQLKKEAGLQNSEDNDLNVRVTQELLEIYISKAVSNMFLVTVMELLERRLSTFSKALLQKSLDDIMKHPLKFVNEVAHPKGKIIRMDKTKYNEILEHYRSKLNS